MASINLAPGTQIIIQAQKRRRRLFLISGVVALVIILVWLGLFLFSNSLDNQMRAIQDETRIVETEIARLADNANRITLFESRLEDLHALLDSHISWNPVLQDLERLLPVEAVLTHMDSDVESGSIIVEGRTANIDQVATTLASLENSQDRKTLFTRADLRGITREERASEGAESTVEYVFSATLYFDPDTLYINN